MLGEALAPLQPEVAFLFSSVHYEGSTDLLEGLYDAVGNPGLVLLGTTGDGFLERGRTGDVGAGVLGLHSEGKVRFELATASGVGADPAATARTCLSRLRQQLGGEPDLAFLLSDFRADASLLESVVRDEMHFPVVGGLAADDNRMSQCYVYANREVIQDAVAMVGARGELRFDIAIGNTLRPVGQPGLIDEADRTNIHRIDGISAMDFIERETGKPVLQSDRGIVALEILEQSGNGEKRLRAIVPDFSTDKGHLGLYGGIEAGKSVRVCLARPEDLVREVHVIADGARGLGFQPVAGLITSCAGRKWLLGGQIEHEVRALDGAFSGSLAIAGFPSFGEIGPLKGEMGRYTRNLFHNMTYVLLLIGA